MIEIADSEIFKKSMHAFFTYGYKKTTLDDIAFVVGVSRQTLYKRYKSKEELFKRSIINEFEVIFVEMKKIAMNEKLSSEEKLLSYFDEFCGKYVESLKASKHFYEIMDATSTYVKDIIEDYHNKFIDFMAEEIKDLADDKKLENLGVNTHDIATTLLYSNKGISMHCKDYDDYMHKVAIAVKVICTSLG